MDAIKNNKITISVSIICVVLLCLIIIGILRPNTHKLICKSNNGNITLIYNDKELKDYKSEGISYGVEGQKKYIEKIGIASYIDKFSDWFKKTTAGSCIKK